MITRRVYPVTYANEDRKKWIKEQLVFKYKDEKPVSTFLDLRDLLKQEESGT